MRTKLQARIVLLLQIAGSIAVFTLAAMLAVKTNNGHKAHAALEPAKQQTRTVRVVSSGQGAATIASAVEMELKSTGRYKVISEGTPELVLGISCAPIKTDLACSYLWTIFGHGVYGGLVVVSDQSVVIDGIVSSFRTATTEDKLSKVALDISMYVRDYCEHAESANAKSACAGGGKR